MEKMRKSGKRTLSGSLEVIVVALTTLVRPPPNPAVATTIAKELIKLLLESRIAVRRRRMAAAVLERTVLRIRGGRAVGMYLCINQPVSRVHR